MDNKKVPDSIDEYIDGFPNEIRTKLEEIRNIIKEVVPKECTEKISWGMPTFYLYGNLVHFASHKEHIGFYPGVTGIEMFNKLADGFKSTKGGVQLPYNKPLPKEIIQKIVKFRVTENIDDFKAKGKNRKMV